MKMRLQDIASASTGLVISRKISEVGNFIYRALSNKDVLANGIVDLSNSSSSDYIKTASPVSDKYLTKTGDVILSVKFPFTAVYITDDLENIVVNSNFIILTAKTNLIYPSFFAWYLNSNNALKQFSKDTRASSVVAGLTLSFVSNIEIELPSIEIQKNIGDSYVIFNELEKQRKKLINMERTYLSQTLQNVYELSISK